MDDRDHHDTNVVSLRRKDDLRGRDQDQVASTIFAEQDEISTFSQGNLVPPSPPGQSVSQGPTQPADPFFDQHLQRPGTDRELTSDANVGKETDEYFDQLVAQSATEMADELQDRDPPAVSLPGSASLPVHAARLDRHGWRFGVSLSAARWHRGHAAASRSVVILMAAGLLAGAALALIIVSLEHQPPPAQSRGADPQLASMLSVYRNPFKLGVHSSSRSAKAATRSRHITQRRRTKAADRIRTAARVSRGRPSTASASATSRPANVSQSAGLSSGSATGATVTSSPATSEPAPQTSSSPTSGQAASSNNAPAFGPGGTLGPGHSSIG
jgi:hypothetical protein